MVALCEEADALGTATVCVSPSLVAAAVAAAGRVGVGTVIGFPSGAHRPEIKAVEARLAVGEGADELDMVIDLGAAMARRLVGGGRGRGRRAPGDAGDAQGDPGVGRPRPRPAGRPRRTPRCGPAPTT